jgi:hypothetical protein
MSEINTRIDDFDKTVTRQTIVSEDTTSVVKKLWIANLQQSVLQGHEIKELIVPESFLNETVRKYFYHEDTLKYPEGGYSFSRISCT